MPRKNTNTSKRGEELPLLHHDDNDDTKRKVTFQNGPTKEQAVSERLIATVHHHWSYILALLLISMILVVCYSGVLALHSARFPSFISVEDVLGDIAETSLQDLNNNLPMVPITTTATAAAIKDNNKKDDDDCGSTCETTVLLLRHCDDHGIYARDDEESGDKHCSHMGYERTKFLPTLFDDGTTTTTTRRRRRRWPHPTYLFALLPEQPQGINYRQIETLLPLARQNNLTIRVVGEPSHVATAIFEQIRTSPDDMCNKVTVVAWKHAYIPMVAAHLGCGPDQGCRDYYPDDEFDQVWELKFVYNPREPTDEVLDLYQSNSSLLLDGYGLLREQVAAAAATLANEESDGNTDEITNAESSSTTSTSEGGGGGGEDSGSWTVYGSITRQRFDPLALDQLILTDNMDDKKRQ